MESGERVYHTPDSPWYERTDIDPDTGERWFCTEREAEEAGWRAPNRASANPTSASVPTNSSGSCMHVVNVNSADARELEKLPGIGSVKAQGILDYRSSHGNFASVEELEEVKGIGPATLEKIRTCVVLN